LAFSGVGLLLAALLLWFTLAWRLDISMA